MKCDRCDNEAIFEIHFIDNNEKLTISLCRECYFKYINELMPNLNNENGDLKYFQEIVSNLIDSISENIFSKKHQDEENGEKKCSHCGMSISEILESGKFGCSQCYEDFKDEASNLLEKIDDNINHKEINSGEFEGSFNIRTEINKKEEELKELINKEEYEKAAQLRDKIRDLENNI